MENRGLRKTLKEAFENYDKKIVELCRICDEKNSSNEEAIQMFYETDTSFLLELRHILSYYGILDMPEH